MAIREAGLTRLSVPRLRAARRTLQAVGGLQLVGKHRAGTVHQTFALEGKGLPSNLLLWMPP